MLATQVATMLSVEFIRQMKVPLASHSQMMSLASSGVVRAIVRFVVCLAFSLRLPSGSGSARASLILPVSLRAPCGVCTQVELYSYMNLGHTHAD